MYLLKIGTVPLPKLYVCKKSEVRQARDLGIPYVVKPANWDDDKLVKAFLWRTLHEKFPHIKWRELLHIDQRSVDRIVIHVPRAVEQEDGTEEIVYQVTTAPVDIVSSETRENPGYDTCGWSGPEMQVTEDCGYRESGGGLDPSDSFEDAEVEWDDVSIDGYIGDLGWYVDVETLQQLKCLPTFLDDIAEAIKVNLSNTYWMDGYNKKLGCNLGTWQGSGEAPNLIILDVSGSIPSGVAGTMISLIETLRSQANADLIITSGRSEYWAANEELPDPDKLGYLIGGCNECVQFYEILRTRILGRHWGNVVVFGDMDSPLRGDIQSAVRRGRTTNIELSELQSTRIERVLAFNTWQRKVPGYGLWAIDADPNAQVVIDNTWVKYMEGGRV